MLDPARNKTLQTNVSMSLNTMNGPNEVSNENSGFRMAQENGPFDVNTLPRFWAGIGDVVENPDLMHRDLHRDDAMSFLVVFRAGASLYFGEIDDPFFAAHNPALSEGIEGLSYADHEATALGCFEQFQYCLPTSGFCTPWGTRSEQAQTVSKQLIIERDGVSLAELYVLYRMLPSLSSIFESLAQRI